MKPHRPTAPSEGTTGPPSAEVLDASEAYLDRLFGPGMGARHSQFIDKLQSASVRAALHRYHTLEDDESWLSVEDNYLLGTVVMCALGEYGPAAMFAMTLRHRGVPAGRILAAVGRLEMWVGGLRAATAIGQIQRAIRVYDRDGLDAMAAWFPPLPDPAVDP